MLRSVPKAIQGKVQKAFVAGVKSDAFAKIAKRKFFKIDIRLGAEADRRAAQVEASTAATFAELKIKGAKSPAELGLPTPANFGAWWAKNATK